MLKDRQKRPIPILTPDTHRTDGEYGFRSEESETGACMCALGWIYWSMHTEQQWAVKPFFACAASLYEFSDEFDAAMALVSPGTRDLGYDNQYAKVTGCLLYTSPSPRDGLLSRMPSSA